MIIITLNPWKEVKQYEMGMANWYGILVHYILKK
jgi:hypothetical protein